MHSQTKLEMFGGRDEPQTEDRREESRSDAQASHSGQESCGNPQTPSCNQESSSNPRQEEARSCRSAGDDASSAERSRHHRGTAGAGPCSRVRENHRQVNPRRDTTRPGPGRALHCPPRCLARRSGPRVRGERSSRRPAHLYDSSAWLLRRETITYMHALSSKTENIAAYENLHL
jgi:hypothetical protein